MSVLRGLRLICILVLSAGLAVVPVRAQEIITTRTGVIELETSGGALVRLSGTAKTVFVADPNIADIQVKSPRLIYVSGKSPGTTTLFAVDERDRLLANHKLEVSHNLEQLRDSIKSMMPDSSLKVRSVDSSVVVEGTVGEAIDAAEVRRLAEQVAGAPEQVVMRVGVTAPTQVHLRVRVAEVRRDVLKQFGINWDVATRPGNFLFGLAQGRNPVVAPSDDGIATFFGGLGPWNWRSSTSATTFSNSALGAFRSGTLDVNTLIDALDVEGLVTVLAQPNLTAMSGKPANFLAGGEFPILIPRSEDSYIIEFKSYGVSLSFTPTVLSQSRISLLVNPEVSELSDQGAIEVDGFRVPGLTTRRAETTVELGNGQSFVIGGLLQNNTRHEIDKFPGLADIPILGTLFRSNRFQRGETELIIIVTPYIVRPVTGPILASPTDGHTPPTDEDRLLHGRLYHPTPRAPEAPVNPVNKRPARAPVGFVLE